MEAKKLQEVTSQEGTQAFESNKNATWNDKIKMLHRFVMERSVLSMKDKKGPNSKKKSKLSGLHGVTWAGDWDLEVYRDKKKKCTH